MSGEGLHSELSSAASNILLRGVESDKKQRYTEALICYQEGLQLLVDMLRNVSDSQRKTYMRNKVEQYMARAETLKKHIEIQKSLGNYREQIVIADGSKGHSYESILGRFLEANVYAIEVEDPYIRAYHQCQNFLKFCELAVKKCTSLKIIRLVTTSESSASQDAMDRKSWFEMLSSSLAENKVKLIVDISETLHDRTIRISNGWIIKIGRGLDYFKPPENKFSLGNFDMDLRKCHETVVDIFHSENVHIKEI